ncbi:MAG TPA: BREX-1 system adenine-specific DNA-methyltransferase PglX, partial [Halothiobacillus sp.]|nr:BREX-1 system adenine-specific DNA-methyltransferase PglX [Halothiobacillus sp.]
MNKSKLKSYAPQARKDFIAAVTARANQLGLSDTGGKLEVAPSERKGDIAIIAGREWPAKVYEQRERLTKHIQTVGFSQTMEAVAYTWFNRFAALRYMEIHDYLDHGLRVLSNRAGGMPEILNQATELELPGFNKSKAIELKLAGNKDGELYKMLLVAQCNALSRAMPFLFEHIDDETELLLPDNLLRTDSIIAKLVTAIPEEDWQQVEIIGWLYQFYISEKKDEVIGKVVKSEDIPAATQLFTPNWIVQYLVQNSVGRLWLMSNPASTLKSQWPYYIEPAEQTPEVQARLDALIQTRMDEDGGSLNPETITVLDSACGSGHILVVAYDVLKSIYLERGYQLRAIPRLILEKNLYGLDIDDRAAQMAGFALMMKARADDRRLFDNPPKLNVMALQESKGLDADEIIPALNSVRVELVEAPSIRLLIDTFANAKTFGSLIQIPPKLIEQLATMDNRLQQAIQNGDLYAKAAAQDLLPLAAQARVLGMQFDAVVANPPYMSRRGMNSQLKLFVKDNYPDSIWDIYSAFISRNMLFASKGGYASFMAPQTWMFLGSHHNLRLNIISQSLTSLIQLSYSGFSGAAVAVCAFTVQITNAPNYSGTYIKLSEFSDSEDQAPRTLEAISNKSCTWKFTVNQSRFKKVPNSPICYWVKDCIIDAFDSKQKIKDISFGESLTLTGDNDRFLRYWWEVNKELLGRGKKWLFYAKGGKFRKWYGNFDYVINWSEEAIEYYRNDKTARIIPEKNWYKRGITWTLVTSAIPSFRYLREDSLYDVGGASILVEDEFLAITMAFLNSRLANELIDAINPSVNLQVGDVLSLPLLERNEEIESIVADLIDSAKRDWDASEMSLEFVNLPLGNKGSLIVYFDYILSESSIQIERHLNGEKNINEFVADKFGIKTLEISLPIEQITLWQNPSYRYAGNFTEVERLSLFRKDTLEEIVSYIIGCMMGRYSLDEPGLIYARASNVGFDATRYQSFPADTDGIVPITDDLWFEDDAASRIREFLLAVWGAETLEENMAWLAESLGRKGNETPEETIRRYLASFFFKNHLQTYKKRP